MDTSCQNFVGAICNPLPERRGDRKLLDFELGVDRLILAAGLCRQDGPAPCGRAVAGGRARRAGLRAGLAYSVLLKACEACSNS